MIHSSTWRTTLIMLFAIGAVSAVAGAIGLLTDTLQMEKSVLDGSPFSSFTIPGLILGFIVGGSQLIALVALLRHADRAIVFAGVAGGIMAGWIAGEVLLVGSDPGAMRNLQVPFFLIGILEILLAAMLLRRKPYRA
jgi:hypothetical protein